MMIVIFAFSSQSSTESTQVSDSVGMLIGRLIIPGFDGWTMVEKLSFASDISFFVRKGAHFSIYTVLGVSLFFGLQGLIFKWKNRAVTAVLIGVIYSMTDEFHQSFVPGRSMEVRDVGIDSFGVLCGVFLCLLFCFLWMKWKKKR